MGVRAISGPLNRTATKRIASAARNRGYSTPPPIAGWNARDSLASMEESDAVTLDNWFPEQSWVRLRRGYVSHATGLGTTVESLMAWHGPSSAKLFGAVSSAIYNVTAATAVGAAELSGLGNGRWQHTMMETSAGSYLYIVNGVDDPRHYDGSTWSTPTLTGSGLTNTDLIHINVFKRRLFFIEQNSTSFWYLPVDSIAGTLTEFDLGALCSLGGHLVAMGTWTRDGGDGIDDYAVFVTSQGQVVVFVGTDPSSTSHWSHVGTFTIGAPIGRRCMVSIGADLVIMTVDGFSQVSRFMQGGRTSEKAAMSDKIEGAVKTAVLAYKDSFGWQPILYPLGGMIIFNIPIGTLFHQYVSNSTTGAWCRFKGMNASCWEVFGDALYFGGPMGNVYHADYGLSDDGGNIDTEAKPAFSYFGNRGQRKRLGMVRPNLTVDGSVDVAMAVNIDFDDSTPATTPSFTPLAGSEWDVATWDVDAWGESSHIAREWQIVSGFGQCATVKLRTSSKDGSILWNSTDWQLEMSQGPGYL